MPLYEYECGSCGHRFERIQKFSDPPEKTCPKCGGEVHKLMAAPAVQFKGSGWYVTDYAGKGKESKARKDSAEGTEKTTEATEKKTEATEKSGETSRDTSPKETKSTKDTPSNSPSKS
jgi:putative FmdB family regulatory protein